MNIHYLTTPLAKKAIIPLQSGDKVFISGIIYTARDTAHKRVIDLQEAGEKLPIPIENQIIYYVGPAPTPPGKSMGSAGPTTSYRMDPYTPPLLDAGLSGMIGKGPRSQAVIDSIIKNGAVYFAAVGGAAALIASSVLSKELIAYPDLGPEAIYKLEVKNFPCIVAVDSQGNDLFKTEIEKYKKI